MRVLLDTHAFLWWVADSRRLSELARDAIRNEANDVVVSAVSAWDIATKHHLGRLPEAEELAGDIRGAIVGQGFSQLPMSIADAERSGRLPGPHRDPSIACSSHRPWRTTWRSCPTRRRSTGTAVAAYGDERVPARLPPPHSG